MLPTKENFATLDQVDDRLLLHRMTMHEHLGGLFTAELEILSDIPNLQIDTLLGNPLTVCVLLFDGSVRFWNGIVTRISRTGATERFDVLRATLSPKLWLARHTRNCRIFENASVPDVVKEVLDPAYLPVSIDRLDATSYKKWDYIVQYRESDFAFASRLLEQEGIYYYFKHAPSQHTMMLADSVASHDETPGYEEIPVVPPELRERDRDNLYEWRAVHRTRGAKTALQAYDFRFNAGANLLAEGRLEPNHFRAGEDDLEAYDYAEHYLVLENRTQPDDTFSAPAVKREGERYAKIHVEEAGVERDQFEGEGNVRGLTVGALFKIVDDQAPEDRLLAVSTETTVQNALLQTGYAVEREESLCRTVFTAISSRVQYRPARVTPKPVVPGPETAIVVGPEGSEIDTDKYGRVHVHFHWEREKRSSCWLRVAQAWAGASFGAWFLPRIGHEVVVDFLGGDPDRPIVTGCVYNENNKTPYELPEHATVSTIKSHTSPKGTEKQYNEIRFQDKKGHEQVFLHSQGRMDVLVRGSHYETAGGNREEVVGHDDKGDFNRLVANDINLHNKGGRFELVDKKLNQNVKLEVVEVFENNHTVAVTDRQTLNANEIAVEAKATLSLKSDKLVVQGASGLSLKAGDVKVEGTQSITLKCGGSFVVLTPSGVYIKGSTVFINTGGAPKSADAPLTIEDPTLETPIDAASAMSGIPGSTSHAGGGGGGGAGGGASGGRTRQTRKVVLKRAPEPPKPPAPAQTTGPAPESSDDRALLTIEWVEKKTFCGGPATLKGTTKGYADGSSENAEIKNAVDGETVAGLALSIKGNAFNQAVEVKDWLPRDSGGSYEKSRDEDAIAAGQKTPKPLSMKWIPNANKAQCSITGRAGTGARFPMEVKDFVCVIASGLDYVEGWFGWVISLGNTVSADTGGLIGKVYETEGWRFSKLNDEGKRLYHDGKDWQAVPDAWVEAADGSNLYGNALWKDGADWKAQFGGKWPDPMPAWKESDRTTAKAKITEWENTAASTWTHKFDLRRQGCQSSNVKCCRYSVKAGIKFNAVAEKKAGVMILGANAARSNSGALSLSRPGRTAAHEFGHHLGNPDEYRGAPYIDTGYNGDGAAAGIDESTIMGSGWDVKARHFDVIKKHLSALVKAEEGVDWDFDAIAH